MHNNNQKHEWELDHIVRYDKLIKLLLKLGPKLNDVG